MLSVALAFAGLGLGAAWSIGQAAERPYFVLEVVGERVNFRAKPSQEAEVVGQLHRGDLVQAKSLGQQWVEIAPPDGMHVWAHRDFVSDGVVTASSLNLRAGPGINYTVVGEVPQGTHLASVESFGDWLKIPAPASCTVWVSREFLHEVQPLGSTPVTILDLPALPVAPRAEDAPAPTAEQAPADASTPPASVPPEAYAPPSDLDLVPLAGQGKETRVQGRLVRSGLGFGRPTAFRLITVGKDRQTTTVCYVRGNTEQLRKMLHRDLLIVGREYWVRQSKIPVVIPERIILPDG